MSYKSLLAYQKSFALAMDVFEVTRRFPKEERHALIDQIRRSSRSVCANLAEAYRKRQYKAHFLSKLSDADMENSETEVWIEFSKSCQYIDEAIEQKWKTLQSEVSRLIGYMMQHPDKFL